MIDTINATGKSNGDLPSGTACPTPFKGGRRHQGASPFYNRNHGAFENMLKYVDMVELTSNHEDCQRWHWGDTFVVCILGRGHIHVSLALSTSNRRHRNQGGF